MRRRRTQYWIDIERLDLSQNLIPQICGGIRLSRCLFFLESEFSRASPWVRFEVSKAEEAHLPVVRVPIRGDRTDVVPWASGSTGGAADS
ncbi:hypothetical protein [Kineosporia sp. NBRC 101677]|uniref:hypothetical protein n=1 Tax=Kineosporia TaxID=49184 RepID=UPI00332A21BA